LAAVEALNDQFELMHRNLIEVLELVPEERLYWKPFESKNFIRVYSVGELISHIGGIIEYTFNGLMSNYWDDPFEWTLREALPTRSHLVAYLEEVARVRRLAFDRLQDEDLAKVIHFPNYRRATIGEVLIDALAHASHHRGQIYAYVHLFSDARLPQTRPRSSRV
jgi:uncharacterized damage-inducible protein DinB